MDGPTILQVLPRLRRYARALVGERAAADDLVQDTLERAWSRVAQWQPNSDLRAWLFSIMHNLRVDELRRPQLPTRSLSDEDLELPTRATQTDRLAVQDLQAALAQLPPEQRAVLLLVTLEDMPYAEVAATLSIPVGTVMSRLSRGRERLRVLMGEEGDADNHHPSTESAPIHLRVVK